MEWWDERAHMENKVASQKWFRLFRECRGEALTTWVSTFHAEKLPCTLVSNDLSDDFRGWYNWACVVVFDNKEKWVVRFPIPGKVMKLR